MSLASRYEAYPNTRKIVGLREEPSAKRLRSVRVCSACYESNPLHERLQFALFPNDTILCQRRLRESTDKSMSEVGQPERTRLLEKFGKTFAAGESIYLEGDAANACFIVHEGRVRLVKQVRGTERSLTVIRPGELFGEESFLAEVARNASAIALTKAIVLELDNRTFGALVTNNPNAAMRVIEQLVTRLRNAEEQLENVMIKDHPSRVINSLLRLAAVTKPGPQGYCLQVTPLELSSRVGLDVETVKGAVNQLRSGGYLQISEELVIIADLEPLRKLYDLLGKKEEVRSPSAIG